MAILITGLGNPGKQYEGTRHNIGFAVLDALAEKKGLSFESGRFGLVCKFQMSGRLIYLLKPTGGSVLYFSYVLVGVAPFPEVAYFNKL